MTEEFTTWDNLLKEFKFYMTMERSFSQNTSESYIFDCSRFVDFMKEKHKDISPNEVSVNILEEFIFSLEKKQYDDEEDILLKSTTQTRIIQGIRAFFKFLILNDNIDSNPSELLVTPKLEKKLPDILEREEVKALLNIFDTSTSHGFRNRLTIALLYSTGLRVSEFINLKLYEINFREEFLDIIGKGNKERFVPVESSVLNELEYYIEHFRANQYIKKGEEDYVFISNKRGSKLTRQFIFKMLRESAAKAGINKTIHPHILRHSFATELIRSGANIIAVKEMMGHTSIRSTEVYINLDTKDLRKTLFENHPFYQKDFF